MQSKHILAFYVFPLRIDPSPLSRVDASERRPSVSLRTVSLSNGRWAFSDSLNNRQDAWKEARSIMPFVRYPGLPGKVYMPKNASADAKKHPCKDCYACQMCSDDRCRSCRCQDRGTRPSCNGSVKRAPEEPQE